MSNTDLILEYKKTLEILNTQKKNLILKIEDKVETLDNINKYIDQMIKIDQIIKDYNEKIQNLDTKIPNIQNIDKENIINKKSNNLINNNENHTDKIETSINKIHPEESLEKEKIIDIDDKIITDINKNNGKIDIKVKLPKNNFHTIYKFKNKSRNFYFYQCKVRPKCKGLAKFSIKEQKLLLTRKCNEAKYHNIITYDEFCECFDNNKLSLIDFNIKKMQKFLITKLFQNNKDNENINIKKEYSKITKIELKLNSNEISKIKSEIVGKYKGLSLLDCISKLKELNNDIEFISQDVK